MLGLILSLVTFVYLSFKNWNIAFCSIISGIIALSFNTLPIWDSFLGVYAEGFSSFASKWWYIFVLGAVFGKCMQESGLSESMANILANKCKVNAILLVLMVSLILSYGGISTFIIAFTVYPIAFRLFNNAGISVNLLPASILFCPTTLCMTMLPGTPSIQNIIPTDYLQTNIYAAPLLGIISSVITFLLGYLYLKKASSTMKKAVASDLVCVQDYGILSFCPCIILWVVSFILSQLKYDSQFAVSIAMIIAIIICICLGYKKFDIKKAVNSGTAQGLQTLAFTSCIMGYGSLIQETDGFIKCTELLYGLNAHPLLSSVLAINIIAAITGSSTSSLQIFLELFSEKLLLTGLPNTVLHRIIAIASGGMDSMPYATGVVVTNELANTSLHKTYGHIFITCAIIPIISLTIIVFLYSMGIS